MTIRKAVITPVTVARSSDAFIDAAPDARPEAPPALAQAPGPVEVTPQMLAKLPRNVRGHKIVTTIGLAPETMARIDATAAALGLARAAWITMVINQSLAK